MRNTLIAGLVLTLLMALRADIALSNGLCGTSESAYFTCRTTIKRWISLCGTLPEKLQYRFGTDDRVELRYPENATGGTEGFRFAHYSRFQTDRLEVTFRNKGVDYAIFDYTEADKQHAGIRVITADGKEREFLCTNRVTSRLVELKDVLRCDKGNALNGGECP